MKPDKQIAAILAQLDAAQADGYDRATVLFDDLRSLMDGVSKLVAAHDATLKGLYRRLHDALGDEECDECRGAGCSTITEDGGESELVECVCVQEPEKEDDDA